MDTFAVRGAITVAANERDAIVGGTTELVQALMARNRLEPSDLISCIFTVTEDLDAEFPAAAARKIGLDRVPLLCAREIPVPGSMERVIRVMVHFRGLPGVEPEHVYLGAAQELRPDLGSAQ
jgi:chorismate mutase